MPRTKAERNQRRRELRKARKLGDLAPASVLVKKDRTAYMKAARRRARQRRVGDVSSSTESCESADERSLLLLPPHSPTASISEASVEPNSEPEAEPAQEGQQQFDAVSLEDPPESSPTPADSGEPTNTAKQGHLQVQSFPNDENSAQLVDDHHQQEITEPANNGQLLTEQEVELNNAAEDQQRPEDDSAGYNREEPDLSEAAEDQQQPEDDSAGHNHEEPDLSEAAEDQQQPEDNYPSDDAPESEGTRAQQLTRALSRAFVREQTLHKMSKEGATAMLQLVDKHLDDLVYLRDTLGHLPSFKTMSRKAELDLPTPKIEILFRSKVHRDEAGKFIERLESKLEAYPKKQYPSSEWSTVYEITWLNVKEVIHLHQMLHPEHQITKVWISDDGVSPIRSSPVSFHMYCIMFEGCWTPYPIMVFHPNPHHFKRDLLPQKDLAKRFLTLIDEASLTLLGILADGKVRPVWQQIKTQPAKFGCQYCEVQAVRVSKEDEFRLRAGLWPKESGPLTWSYKTTGYQKRTHQRLEQFAARVLEEDDPDELRGVIGRSCLFDYQTHPVDIIKQVPHDYMHTVASGVIKRVAENLFWPGKCKVTTIVRRYQTEPIDM